MSTLASSSEQTSVPLRLGRHAVAMMAVAAANPLIYHGTNKAADWAATWAVPLVLAGVFYAVYALFFTRRAKAAWPGSAISVAWVFLVLSLAGIWSGALRDGDSAPVRSAVEAPSAAPPAPGHSISPSNPFLDPDLGKELLKPSTN